MTKRKWPEEVPILTAQDIHKGSLHSRDGCRHCLLGWLIEAFPIYTLDEAVVRRRAQETVETEIGTAFIAKHNDSRSVSKEQLAREWNAAMARLGYTVGNPLTGEHGTTTAHERKAN